MIHLFKSFKVEARHHKAHGVTHLKGRWSDEKLQRFLTIALERKHEEEEECNVKRKYLSNIEYGEFTDFALYLVNKLEKNEEQIGQIARMAVVKNDILIDIWGSLITQKDENAKLKKFVALINFQFDMHLKIKDEA
ncbi:hypothetical protein F8M41_025326 [Gigaspora margarita]|uniref:Uncharacterized protein n=1 Tax=Gigaspora margarita TaxID=4874 RepID=A0A8H4B588_GIGMA|nr:hypothetical protein F8M41_025326 [Gigaspora margarita]